MPWRRRLFFFFFNDTATPEIYTLSLHDALPISASAPAPVPARGGPDRTGPPRADRKSTRLNSSHDQISYAVFCLKKKKNTEPRTMRRRSREQKTPSTATNARP